MRTFLCKNKKPIISWGNLPQDTYYEGKVPEGYKLAINPTPGIIIVDIDVDSEKNKNGFLNIPGYKEWLNSVKEPLTFKDNIFFELERTYNYKTKRKGAHFWLKYTGNKELLNKASNQSIDLRVGMSNNGNGGYAIYYPANNGDDIRNHLHEIKETSIEMNNWLEELFC